MMSLRSFTTVNSAPGFTATTFSITVSNIKNLSPYVTTTTILKIRRMSIIYAVTKR